MVQRLLSGTCAKSLCSSFLCIAVFVALLFVPALAGKRDKPVPEKPWPNFCSMAAASLPINKRFPPNVMLAVSRASGPR